MIRARHAGIIALTVLFGPSTVVADTTAGDARFAWFDYSGHDPVFETPLAEDEFRNPILAGFHPDPSIVRVDDDYYLVNSTFGFFPGIPVFHSRDLVNWAQIGNAIHRPEQLPYEGIHLGYNGVYAPAIEHRDGVFYVINTCVACGGNFVVTATDPAGPWSDPTWLPHITGIDPSIFFDDNGRAYVVHHAEPDEKRYDAHTAIRVMEIDPVTFAQRSEDVLLVDGGDDAPWPTDYIEGPHLYRIDGRYYLSAPGGGTGYFHGQLVYRSDSVFGPYEAYPGNPVLTQLGLPDDREDPVTATGHGDFVKDRNGDWWIVFLGTRVYDLQKPPQDPGRFHTGRETFMLPVSWENGWPRVLKDAPVPYAVRKPKLSPSKPAELALTGNFSIRETFTSAALAPHWLFVRAPVSTWWSTGDAELRIQPRTQRIGHGQQPAFIGRRLAHMTAEFGTQVTFTPRSPGDEAGLMAVQNDAFYYAFGLGLNPAGNTVVFVRMRAGEDEPVDGHVLAEAPVDSVIGQPLQLRIRIDRSEIDFSYSLDGTVFTPLLEGADSSVLTTARAGGFTGAVVGMYAQGAGLRGTQTETR